MNLKRALQAAVVLYIALSAIILFLVYAMKIDFSSGNELSPVFWFVILIASVIISALGAFWYFGGKGVEKTRIEGLRLGLIFLSLGAVIDLVFVIILFIAYGANLLVYYKAPLFWVTLVLVIVSTTYVGRHLEN